MNLKTPTSRPLLSPLDMYSNPISLTRAIESYLETCFTITTIMKITSNIIPPITPPATAATLVPVCRELEDVILSAIREVKYSMYPDTDLQTILFILRNNIYWMTMD